MLAHYLNDEEILNIYNNYTAAETYPFEAGASVNFSVTAKDTESRTLNNFTAPPLFDNEFLTHTPLH